MYRYPFFSLLLISIIGGGVAYSQNPKQMPREDVIDVPAIGDGLCVSNVFQSNMVLQRDKPISIWGWAGPGEEVTVTIGDLEEKTKAADDRTWKITLPAMEACSSVWISVVTGTPICLPTSAKS